MNSFIISDCTNGGKDSYKLMILSIKFSFPDTNMTGDLRFSPIINKKKYTRP